MVKLSDIKCIDEKKNIYEANLKILFKKIKKESQYDIYYYKSLLTNKKIFDIIEEDNNIYIYYDSDENIDELIFSKEKQVSKLKGHCKQISQNEIEELFKKEDEMCKIISQKIKNGSLEAIVGTGFFLGLDIKNIPFKKCLITNNHILDEDDIKINRNIIIEYKNKKKVIKIIEKYKQIKNWIIHVLKLMIKMELRIILK